MYVHRANHYTPTRSGTVMLKAHAGGETVQTLDERAREGVGQSRLITFDEAPPTDVLAPTLEIRLFARAR